MCVCVWGGGWGAQSRDGCGGTPLHDAALGGRTPTAALLIDGRADVDARNGRGAAL